MSLLFYPLDKLFNQNAQLSGCSIFLTSDVSKCEATLEGRLNAQKSAYITVHDGQKWSLMLAD